MTDAEWIDDFARKLCVNLGLDTETLIEGDDFTGLTLAEIAAKQSGWKEWMPMTAHYVPQWRTFRERAEMALAIHRTVKQMAEIPE